MTETSTASTARGGRARRRLRVLLAALAALVAMAAGYAVWTNVRPYTLQASARGATLTNRMHDATGDTTFTPTVLIVEPGRELRWIGRVGPGGVAVPFYEHWLHTDTLPMFRAMDAALAREAGGRS